MYKNQTELDTAPSSISSFLHSPSHTRSNSAYPSSSESNPIPRNHPIKPPSCLQNTKRVSLPSSSTITSRPLDHHSSFNFTSTMPTMETIAGISMTSKHNSDNNRSQFSTASPVYQPKRISHRYSASPASSYTAYSTALAASYQQHQQQQLQQQHQYQHTRSLGQIPTSNTHMDFNTCSAHTTDNFIKHRYNGNSCTCSSESISNKRFNSPPSPCLSALDSACRTSLISHDPSTFPSPSLSASSTDSVFSSASSTSMAHCSPILPNNISALLLHDISSSESSMVSSPVLSSCSSPRTPSSPAPLSITSSPSPSPPPNPVRSRRTASTGSRTSQISGSSSQTSGYYSQHDPNGILRPSSSSSCSSTSRSGRTGKRRSVGTHSSSPLSRPLSIHDHGVPKSIGTGSVTESNAMDASNSPQAAILSSTRYIRLLLLPLIPLLFFALGAQTSANFETPAKYDV